VVTKKSMLLVGTESLETKKMKCGMKRKGKMMGGYNKDKRMGKAMGGMMKGSQPSYSEAMPKCMPN